MQPKILVKPNFDDYPLTLSQGKWLPRPYWNPQQFASLAHWQKQRCQSLQAAPKIYHHKRKSSAKLSAIWILVDLEGKHLAFAELQSYPIQKFYRGFLDVQVSPSLAQAEFFASDWCKELFASLIGLCFTLGRIDHLSVASQAQASTLYSHLSAEAGNIKEVFSFSQSPWLPSKTPILSQLVYDVDRWSWQKAEALHHWQKNLKYLERRIERLEGLERKAKLEPRRPFLARLFKPRIKDSLF